MHDHSHSHGHCHDHSKTKNLGIAFALNIVFSIIEIVGGIFTNSMAIISDAIHDLGDSFSIGIAWYLQKYSNKAGNRKFSYGYKRFSLFAALINGLILSLGSIYILSQAIPRLLNPVESNAEGMIYLAILGVAINGFAAWRMRGSESINEKVISLHLIEDVLGWVAVLVGAIIMYFFHIPIIDPILSIVISLFILYNVYHNLSKTVAILLQQSPDEHLHQKVVTYFKNTELIKDIHDLHIWSMDGEYHVLTVHVVIDDYMEQSQTEKLKQEVRTDLTAFGISHATIETELLSYHCEMVNCN